MTIVGLYHLTDGSGDRPLTDSTLTELAGLTDDVLCTDVALVWTANRSVGIDLGGPGEIERIKIYAKRADATEPTGWYTGFDSCTVYKSDNNSDWTLVEAFSLTDGMINPVSGSCAHFTLEFATAHEARYFKVHAVSGLAWDPGGGSLYPCEIIATADYKTRANISVFTSRTPGAGFGVHRPTRSQAISAVRGAGASFDHYFSSQVLVSSRPSAAILSQLCKAPAQFFTTARTPDAQGVCTKPCRAQAITTARGGDAQFGLPAPTRAQAHVTVRGADAEFGLPYPTRSQIITEARTPDADLDAYFGAQIITTVRSSDALALGSIPTRAQILTTVRSYGHGLLTQRGLQRLLYSIVEQGYHLVDGGFGLEGRQRILTTLSAGQSGLQRILQSLAEAPQTGLQRILGTLDTMDTYSGLQRITMALIDYDAKIVTGSAISWDILMDGKSIKSSLIGRPTIDYDESNVHNEMTLESADKTLFSLANPLDSATTHDFTVTIGDRSMYFTLSGRSGNEDRFRLSAHSNSIQIDEPYQDEVSVNLDYEVLEFTNGNYEMSPGDEITGADSDATGTAVVVYVNSGTWAGGDAAGVIYLADVEGDFLVEYISVVGQDNVARTDGHLTTKTLRRTAADVAGDQVINLVLDWDESVPDWVLPPETQIEGYPIAIIQAIAGEAGAVVRCDDDGHIVVRPKFPVRPVDLQAAVPVMRYNRQRHIIDISMKEEEGTANNTIEVNGWAEEAVLPQIEIEEKDDSESYDQGEDFYVRVYWNTEPPDEEHIPDYVTDGTVDYMGRYTEDVEDELVVFAQGKATTEYPIYSLNEAHVKWLGTVGPGVEWDEYSNELGLSGADEDELGTLYRVAEVTYTKQYDRYRIKNHNVEALIWALEVPAREQVSVTVTYEGGGQYEADGVEAPLLTTTDAAALRGTAELDDQSYDRKVVTLAVPYDAGVTDGVVVEISDDVLEVEGNFLVTRATIVFDGPSVLHELECVQWVM